MVVLKDNTVKKEGAQIQNVKSQKAAFSTGNLGTNEAFFLKQKYESYGCKHFEVFCYVHTIFFR